MSNGTPAFQGQDTSVLRPLIMHGLLFAVLMVLATGLSTLLTATFHGFSAIESSSSQLAVACSFTLIGAPLAWLIWRSLRKRLTARPAPIESVIWALQASGVYLISLAVASCAALAFLAGFASSTRDLPWQSALGAALSWGALCYWQHRRINAPNTAPKQLAQLAATLGNYFSLLLFALSLVATLNAALEIVVRTDTTLVGPSGLFQLLSAIIWLLGSGALWFWHWKLRRVQQLGDALNTYLFLVLAIAAPTAVTLLPAARLLAWALPFSWDQAARSEQFSSDGPLLIALLVSGGLLWLYHHIELGAGFRSEAACNAGRLLVSGISLALLATGLGMLVNALLAGFSSNVTAQAAAELLATGLGLLLVGALSWCAFFRPLQQAWPASRSVYLVLFFGVSAVVALVSLLVLGYRIFDYYLDPEFRSGSLLDTVRGPLGWLVATAAVAAYHYTLWRSGKQLLAQRSGRSPALVSAAPRREVVLVGPAASEPMAAALKARADLSVMWIPAAQPALDDQTEVAVLARIDEYLATVPGPFLAIAQVDGTVQFTELA